MALPKGGFKHFFFDDIDEAVAQIHALDGQGHTTYLAQSTFETSESRKQTNALWLQNFFLDIDCGEGKDYPDQKTAVAALKKLLADTGLPFPAIMTSGNGLYAHWFLEEKLDATRWQVIARLLKKTLAAYGFKADPARTSDSSSVLRPPGTTNRKPGKAVTRVALLKDADPLPVKEFGRILLTAARRAGVDAKSLQPPKVQTDLNSDFYAGVELQTVPSDALQIAAKCGQLRQVKDAQGNVSEPLWYAGLGLLTFCMDTDALVQEWSSGHPDYSAGAAEAKAQQYRDSDTGPPTCAHLGSINPQGCLGCKHINKIKSPIVLGRPEPKAVVLPLTQTPSPTGYRRSTDGLWVEVEGEWTQFYDCDLAPVRLSYDASLGYEVVTIKHTLPHEGDLEFTIRSSLIQDPKMFMVSLSDNHVKVVGNGNKKAMVSYMESYMQQLQRNRRMTELLCQMGWRESRAGKPMFVLGRSIYHADGSVESAALARNVPQAAEGFRTSGDLRVWSDATALLDQPGMEAHAFALLCGFAAPLMKFTGFDGAVVSMTGDSGTGKTLMQRMVQSIYGYHNDLMMLRDDTRNALISRLGVYGTLPLTIDEVTNIDGLELSDLVYRITQGRDKARLTKNAEERKNLNSWNTLALISTNASLVDRLGSLKHDATPEINRIFEYPVLKNILFEGQVTTKLYWTVHENYGIAGDAYVKWLVQNIEKIKPGLDKVREKIDGDAKMRGEERFWSAVASAAIYGGLVAKSIGIIQFDVSRVLTWATRTIRNMRSDKDEITGGGVDILGQFLDEHANNRLIVKGDCAFGKPAIPIDTPRGQLIIRHEIDNYRLYISRAAFKNWLARKFGNYRKTMEELKDLGVLKDANARKVLGSGTQFSGAQQQVWVIDLKCQKLGAVGLTLVQEAKLLEKGVKNG
jgi:hypothetical protein